jgi:hypothetical protein
MCPKAVQYKIEFQTPKDDKWRCVAFLVSSDGQLSAYAGFKKLRENEKNRFRNNFEHWSMGGICTTRHHGYNKSQHGGKYNECYTFKGKDAKSMLRIHGFLCNPRSSNRSFQVCVLVHHAHKEGHDIDPTALDRVMRIKSTLGVMQTIIESFREI